MNMRLIAVLPLVMMAACSPSGGFEDPAPKVAMSRTDPALPAGFTLYTAGGNILDYSATEPETGGKVVTYSLIAPLDDVYRHYERESEAAGMTYAGRLNAGELLSYESRRSGEGVPHTFSATVLKKGEYTNVTLNFDVTA